MLSWRIFDASARIEGTRGRVRILNPWAPHLLHRVRVETPAGSRRERIAGAATYTCQLEAFARAVREGASFPTGPEDAIANMALIDAAYRAAGLEPRAPSASA